MVAGGTGAGGPSINGPAGWNPAGGGVVWRGGCAAGGVSVPADTAARSGPAFSCAAATGVVVASGRIQQTSAAASRTVRRVSVVFSSVCSDNMQWSLLRMVASSVRYGSNGREIAAAAAVMLQAC